ncbi:MAG: hypothetical protein PVSMB4_18720 [Ktedonobacterales bacterium]
MAGRVVLSTLIKGKLASAALVSTLVATGAAGATTAADHGVFGQQVRAKVESCKLAVRQNGGHGIGMCVSAFASQHGQEERDQHSDSSHGKHSDTNHGNGQGNGHNGRP